MLKSYKMLYVLSFIGETHAISYNYMIENTICYKVQILTYTMIQCHKLVIRCSKTLQIEEQRLNTLHKGHNECILIPSRTHSSPGNAFSPFFFCWFFFVLEAFVCEIQSETIIDSAFLWMPIKIDAHLSSYFDCCCCWAD